MTHSAFSRERPCAAPIRAAAIPEACGDEALCVDPLDKAGIAAGLRQALDTAWPAGTWLP